MSGFRWSFYGVSDVNVAISLAAILGFLALCLLAVLPPLIARRFHRAQGAAMLGIYAVYVGLLVSGVAA